MNNQVEMAFSKEDRKQVYNFFEKILLEISEPVYYDHLRGHVNKAPENVKKYVYKECKGENLLKYFKTRKNYFNVSLKGDVSLRKSRYRLSSYQSELNDVYDSEEENIDDVDIINVEDNIIEETTEKPESRSSSVSSNTRKSTDCNLSPLTDIELKEKIEYEKIAKKHFCKFLNKRGRVHISTIDIEDLPKKVKRFINKYSNNKLKTFFKSYPHLFSLDEDEHVMFVSSLEEDSSLELKDNQENSDSSKQTIDNFLRCAEFFVRVLKQKNSTPLKNLSGTLSRAPPAVLTYLRSNYDSYRHFLTSASFLFSVDKNDKVSLIYDHSKKLKQAKKFLFSKFCTEPFQIALENLFEPQVKTDKTIEEVNPVVGNTEQKKDFLNSVVVKDNVSHASFSATDDGTLDNLKSDLIVLYYEIILKNASSSVEILQDVNSINNVKTFFDFYDFKDFKTARVEEVAVIHSIKRTLECFVESLFTTQFLCLEILERKKISIYSHEYEAVKYFVEILEENSQGKYMLITSLKGKLALASKGIQYFFRQLYKGEKFVSFFHAYKEFHTDSNNFWVKLSSGYKKYLKSRKETHSNFSKGIKLYDLHTLFSDSHFNNIFAEVFYCLAETCRLLKTKSNCFLIYVSGIFSKSSTLEQYFESLFFDKAITKRCTEFLLLFDSLFYIEEPQIEIRQELDKEFLFDLFNTFWKKTEESLKSCAPYFHTLFKKHLTCGTGSSEFDKKETVIEIVKEDLTDETCCRYPDLSVILGFDILISLIFEKKDSRHLLKLLEDSGLFEIKDGLIKEKNVDKSTQPDPFKTAAALTPNMLTKIDYTYKNRKTVKNSLSPLPTSNAVSSCNIGKEEMTNIDSYCKYCYCKKEVMHGCALKPIDDCDFTYNSQSFGLSVNNSDNIKNVSNIRTKFIHKRIEDTRKMDLLGDSSSYLKSIEVLCNESTHHLLATKDESHQPKVDSNSTSNPLLFTDSVESERSASNNVPNSSCCSEIKDKKKNANNFGEHPKSEVEGCSGKADTENNRTLKSLCINENKVKEAIEHRDKNVLSYPGSNANVNENFVDLSNSKKNIDLDIEIESKFSKDNANSVNDHRGSKTSIIIENSACSLETNNEEEIKTIKTVDGSVLHHIVAAISPNVVTDTNSNSSDLSHAIEKVPFGKSEELQSRNLIEQSDSKQNTSSSGDESDLEMRAIDNFLNCTYPEENLLFEKIGEKSDKEFNSSLVSSQSLVEAFDFVTKQDSPLDKNSKNFSSPFSTIEDSKNLTLDSISVGSSTSKETESDHLSDKSVNQNDKSGIITPVDKLVKNEYVKMPKSKSEPVFDENELCNSFENFSLFDFNKHSKSDSNIIGNSTSVNNYKPKFRCMDKISRSAITDRFRKLSEVYQIKHTENSKDACLESKNAPNQDCSKNTTSCEESVILKPWYKIFRNENLKDDNKKPVREKSIFTIPTTSDKNIDSSTIENKTGESKSIKEDSSLYAFKDHCANIRTNVSEDLVNDPSVKEFSKGNKIKDNLISDCSKQTENSSAKSALFSTLSKPKLDLSNFKFPTSRHENGDKMDSNLSDVTKMNENEVNPIEKTCEEVSSGCNQDKDSRVVSTISNSSNSSKEDLTTSKLSTQQNENKICVLKKAEKGNESEINFVPICSTLNSGNCVSSPSNISENSKLSQKSSSEENEKGNQTKMSILKELAEKNNENEVKPVSKNLTPSNFKGLTAIQSNTSDNSKLALPSMNFSVKERQIHQSEISVMKQSEDMNNGNKLEFSGNPIANSLPELNGNHNGDFSESNLSNQKHDACFLQPIQSKIIVLTLDSCVLEADIGKCKKYVFCLKSTFHCDEHDDCMNCFNSLSIGDSVLCYLSPNKDPKCGNMLFSFMFCKDSDVKIKKSKFGCEKGSTSSYCDNNQFLKKTKTKVLECQTDFSDQISSSFVQEECHRENSSIYSNNQNKLLSNIETKASECQTDFNDLTNAAKEKMFEAGFQTKLSKVCQTDFCDQKEIGEEKACQTKIQIVSQEVQTKNSKMKLSTVEKECQINVQTVMQETQTDLKLIENGCQTDLIGAVKPCLPAVDESCQVSCSIRSQGVQTVLQSSQTISQTDITGAIRPLVPVSSFKSQTILSGPVRKCVYLAHKSSQSALLSGVSHATQTTDSICTLESHRMAYPKTTDSKTDKNATALSGQQQAADEMCDIGSQTISTGAIMIKKYFMEETGKDAKH